MQFELIYSKTWKRFFFIANICSKQIKYTFVYISAVHTIYTLFITRLRLSFESGYGH